MHLLDLNMTKWKYSTTPLLVHLHSSGVFALQMMLKMDLIDLLQMGVFRFCTVLMRFLLLQRKVWLCNSVLSKDGGDCNFLKLGYRSLALE